MAFVSDRLLNIACVKCTRCTKAFYGEGSLAAAEAYCAVNCPAPPVPEVVTVETPTALVTPSGEPATIPQEIVLDAPPESNNADAPEL